MKIYQNILFWHLFKDHAVQNPRKWIVLILLGKKIFCVSRRGQLTGNTEKMKCNEWIN